MAYWIVKALLTPILRLFYRFDISGSGNVPPQGAVILASNHQSFIDSIFIPLVVRRRVTFVAKAEYFESPTTAWFFRAMGQIPIKRGDGSAAERALASARQVLDAGGVLAIYPEGTRSPDGRLYKGHTGVARLALACRAPVVPIALTGTPEVQPIGSLRPRLWRRVRVRVGVPLTWPVPAGGLEGALDDPQLLRRVTDEIMDTIGALSGQERVDDYAKRHRPARVVTVGSLEGVAAAAPSSDPLGGIGQSNAPVASLKPPVHTERLP
jgi:1-acyl-sn-glycerol-3-phosphate acyltransferase